MSPEQQRIAIAEWSGWTKCREFNPCSGWHDYSKNDGRPFVQMPPDYLNDLNAMHEAEEKLDGAESSFMRTLAGIVLSDWLPETGLQAFRLAHATAAQRAEALIRTIGKWEDKA